MYNYKGKWLEFAKTYLNSTVSEFNRQLPINFPAKLFSTYLLILFGSSLLFWLIFTFIFRKKW